MIRQDYVDMPKPVSRFERLGWSFAYAVLVAAAAFLIGGAFAVFVTGAAIRLGLVVAFVLLSVALIALAYLAILLWESY